MHARQASVFTSKPRTEFEPWLTPPDGYQSCSSHCRSRVRRIALISDPRIMAVAVGLGEWRRNSSKETQETAPTRSTADRQRGRAPQQRVGLSLFNLLSPWLRGDSHLRSTFNTDTGSAADCRNSLGHVATPKPYGAQDAGKSEYVLMRHCDKDAKPKPGAASSTPYWLLRAREHSNVG